MYVCRVLPYSFTCLYWCLTYIREGISDLRMYVAVTSPYPQDRGVTTCIPSGAYVRTSKHLTWSPCVDSCVPLHLKSHVSTKTKGRISITNKSCVSTAIKIRVSSALRVASPTSLKFASLLDQCDNRVCEGYVLSHTRSMSLLLQSVKQYTG